MTKENFKQWFTFIPLCLAVSPFSFSPLLLSVYLIDILWFTYSHIPHNDWSGSTTLWTYGTNCISHFWPYWNSIAPLNDTPSDSYASHLLRNSCLLHKTTRQQFYLSQKVSLISGDYCVLSYYCSMVSSYFTSFLLSHFCSHNSFSRRSKALQFP